MAGPSTARVIDYKASSASIPAREAIAGRNLQLPIYALAVERCVMPGSKVVSGSYLSFQSGGSIGSLDFITQSEKESRNYVNPKDTENIILDYVEAMAAGRFAVAPRSPKVCNKCDHMRICRVSELTRTKSDDDFID